MHLLNRRGFLHQADTIDYDPLACDPDYLGGSPIMRRLGLYQPVLDSGAFRLLRTDGVYEVYERRR